MPEHYWKDRGWRKTGRSRNASQTAIRPTLPVPRIAGYQEHVLRNVQLLPQRAKTDAAASNSYSISGSARWQRELRVLANRAILHPRRTLSDLRLRKEVRVGFDHRVHRDMQRVHLLAALFDVFVRGVLPREVRIDQ